MFETTIGVLHDSPLAIVPLVAILWFVGRSARGSRIVYRIARYAFVLGAIPPFCLFVFADIFGSQSSRRLARTLLDSEMGLVVDMLDILDKLTAAILRAFIQFVAGIVPSDPLAGATSILPAWDPFAALSAVGFLIAVFIAHLLAGVVVIRLTRWEKGVSAADEWLTAAGVVLFVSGLTWMLLQFAPSEFARFELQAAVLASSMGLLTGITVSNLSIELPTWRSGDETAQTDTDTDTKLAADTPSAHPAATKNPTADASTSESLSQSDIGDSRPSFDRLQETVESLLRR